MKKVLIIAGVLAVASLTSCKKDYECTYEASGGGQTVSASIDCLDCSKSDVEDIEDLGYMCKEK